MGIRGKNMNNKCEKFEALFTFGNEEDLLKHIEECEDCREEYEQMNKVSALIKEVKPHYKKTRFTAVRVACALFLIVLCGTTFQYANNNYSIVDTIKYGQQFTAEDLGFATDDYGLIMVGE